MVWHALPGWTSWQDLAKILPRYCQDLGMILAGCCQDLAKILVRSWLILQDLGEIMANLTRFCEDLGKIMVNLARSYQDLGKIMADLTRSCQDHGRIAPRSHSSTIKQCIFHCKTVLYYRNEHYSMDYITVINIGKWIYTFIRCQDLAKMFNLGWHASIIFACHILSCPVSGPGEKYEQLIKIILPVLLYVLNPHVRIIYNYQAFERYAHSGVSTILHVYYNYMYYYTILCIPYT